MLIDTALRGALFALLILLTVRLLRDGERAPIFYISAALCAGLCVQVVSSSPVVEALPRSAWQVPGIAISIGNAVLFWLWAAALFDDDFALQPRHAGVWMVVVGLSGTACFLASGGSSATTLAALVFMRLVPLMCALLAIATVLRHWRGDLVERRRHLRWFVVGTGIAYTLLSLAARSWGEQGRMREGHALADIALLLILIATVAFSSFRFTSSSWLMSPNRKAAKEESQASVGAEAPVIDSALQDALLHTMLHDRAYRREELSVASLAASLKVPEYRLRRVINQQLGYRNFSAFVNSYRLDEVRTALSKPEYRDLPILTIALEAGFQSIGPFNRAFKAESGLTPSEFRKLNSTDS